MKGAGTRLTVAGLILIGTAFLLVIVSPSAAAWCAVAGLAAVNCGTFLMAGMSEYGSRPLTLVATAVAGFILLGFGAALLLAPEGPGGPLWLGLPRRSAIMLLGVGIVPALILPWAFALDFTGDQADEPQSESRGCDDPDHPVGTA